MKLITFIRYTGLALFLAGFGFFLAVFFLSSYQLTDDILKQEIIEVGSANEMPNAANQDIPDKQDQQNIPSSVYAIAGRQAKDMVGKVYNFNFNFIRDLDKVFDKANQEIRKIYGITPEELGQVVNKIAAENDLTYSQDVAASVFAHGDVGRFRQKMLRDYTGWMDGKKFNSKESLQEQLSVTVNNINKDVIQQKGVSKYQEKGLKTSIVKAATIGFVKDHKLLAFILSYMVAISGALLYLLPRMKDRPGIKNSHVFHSSLKHRGWLGMLVGSFLIVFYVFLYFYPYYITNWILMVDPLSQWLSGNPAGEFFLYGFLYTICILVMGIRMILNYRHSNYHIIRTISIIFFQVGFAFLIPEILIRLKYPYYDFKNIWPLDYDFFFPGSLNQLIESGGLGIFMLVWGIILIVVAVPVLVYFFGKRWYCSWVCGCGGLAETFGDPYRQLSDKSLRAWQVERYLVHGMLVFAVLMTVGMIYTFFTDSGSLLGIPTYSVAEVYGFFIGAGFAGVIGTGFYPLMGNRVWCRFGCPLAAYLGIVQRFKSRFRITTNGGQCISCGNCSTYCEVGIDVRWYAQRGQNIIRASCVGCGVCASVCPRGVLKLENAEEKGRFGKPILIGNDSVRVNS